MIMPMSIDVLFTAESTATGGGRDGHVKSSDGRIDLDDATGITAQVGFGNIDVALSAKV